MVKDIFSSDNIVNFINNNLKIKIEENEKNIKKTEHLNIILVGPSGVGKSTLINAILELGKETETVTKFGKPTTMEIKYHYSPKLPFIRLADSRGIEKNQDSGVKKICQQIENFIQKKLETNDPDKYIHCIWYCWTGTRLEDSEIDVLDQLSKQYSLKTLPVIIVYTNAIDPKQSKEAEDYIKNIIKKDNYFIPVLSKDRLVGSGTNLINIKAYNLDKLKEISIQLAKGAVESSCYQGLIEDIKKKIKEEINNLTKIVKDKIKKDVEKIKSKMDLNNKMEDLYNNIINIILNIYNKYIFLNSEIEIQNIDKPKVVFGNINFLISDKSQEIIRGFVIDYFENTMNGYKTNFEKLLVKYSNELSTKIMETQISFNSKHENLLETGLTIENLKYLLKNFISNNISKKTELIALKNSFDFLIDPLIKNFEKFFIGIYGKTIKDGKEFQECTKRIVPSSFDEIEQKIKEYNELKNKEDAPNPQDRIIDEEEQEFNNDINELMENQNN